MKYSILIFSCLLLFSEMGIAQQDAMFTQYLYNAVLINPAYAGSRKHMSIGLLHRSQWLGFGEGAPSTQAFTLHTPMRNKKIGLGFSLYNDRIGVANEFGLQASYAYRFPIGKGDFAIGLQGGLTNWRAKLNELDQQDPGDPAFTGVDVPSFLLPNFGVGVYYSTSSFYVGASIPRLLENDLRREGATNGTNTFANQARHYYLMGGMAIKFSSEIVFRPSILIKNVGLFDGFGSSDQKVAAPTEFDIGTAFLFNELVWAGISLRSAFAGNNSNSSYDSVDLWTQVALKNGLRVGMAYDISMGGTRKLSAGSVEVMLGYEFYYEKKNIIHTRYFF